MIKQSLQESLQEMADFLRENPHIAEIERKIGKTQSIRLKQAELNQQESALKLQKLHL